MPLLGRGANYSRARHVAEWMFATAYRGAWPARVVKALGMQREVHVREHRVALKRWVGPELRIVFASDLHAGPTTHPSVLDEAFAKIAAAKPDVLLLGGDYVFLSAEHIHQVADRLAKIKTRIFAVMGNHDLWADDAEISRALTAAGARVLVNERVDLGPCALVGLDDPWTGDRVTPPFHDDDAVRILLVHAPEAMLYLENAKFDLALCGHTHGGHIALPGGVPVLVPGPLSRKFAHGRYDLGNRSLIVSRGVGSTEVALRTFADPDILVVTLGN